MKKQMKEMREQGITLVSLVVTIIILLILTGVTLNIALSENGIFERTKEAVEKYKKAEEDEENAIDMMKDELEKLTIDYNDYVGCYVDGYNPDTSSTSNPVKLETSSTGSQDVQTYSTEGMKWRIWDYNQNTKTIRLISEKPTSKQIILKGINGYNNGIWVLNEICRKCYGKNIDGISATNIKRSDIEEVMKYDYTEYEGGGGFKYGFSEEFINDLKYPAMWYNFDQKWNEKEDKKGLIWEKENGYQANQESINLDKSVVKQSKWQHEFGSDALNSDWEESKKIYYNLIFKDGENNFFNKFYWLSTRFSDALTGYYAVGIQAVNANSGECSVFGGWLYSNINGDNWSEEIALRPMVSIDLQKSGYTLEKVEDDTSKSISFKLVKNN